MSPTFPAFLSPLCTLQGSPWTSELLSEGEGWSPSNLTGGAGGGAWYALDRSGNRYRGGRGGGRSLFPELRQEGEMKVYDNSASVNLGKPVEVRVGEWGGGEDVVAWGYEKALKINIYRRDHNEREGEGSCQEDDDWLERWEQESFPRQFEFRGEGDEQSPLFSSVDLSHFFPSEVLVTSSSSVALLDLHSGCSLLDPSLSFQNPKRLSMFSVGRFSAHPRTALVGGLGLHLLDFRSKISPRFSEIQLMDSTSFVGFSSEFEPLPLLWDDCLLSSKTSEFFGLSSGRGVVCLFDFRNPKGPVEEWLLPSFKSYRLMGKGEKNLSSSFTSLVPVKLQNEEGEEEEAVVTFGTLDESIVLLKRGEAPRLLPLGLSRVHTGLFGSLTRSPPKTDNWEEMGLREISEYSEIRVRNGIIGVGVEDHTVGGQKGVRDHTADEEEGDHEGREMKKKGQNLLVTTLNNEVMRVSLASFSEQAEGTTKDVLLHSQLKQAALVQLDSREKSRPFRDQPELEDTAKETLTKDSEDSSQLIAHSMSGIAAFYDGNDARQILKNLKQEMDENEGEEAPLSPPEIHAFFLYLGLITRKSKSPNKRELRDGSYSWKKVHFLDAQDGDLPPERIRNILKNCGDSGKEYFLPKGFDFDVKNATGVYGKAFSFESFLVFLEKHCSFLLLFDQAKRWSFEKQVKKLFGALESLEILQRQPPESDTFCFNPRHMFLFSDLRSVSENLLVDVSSLESLNPLPDPGAREFSRELPSLLNKWKTQLNKCFPLVACSVHSPGLPPSTPKKKKKIAKTRITPQSSKRTIAL